MMKAMSYRRLLRRKPIESLLAESGTDGEGGELERTVGAGRLAMLGIGSTVGTGIFVVLNVAVPEAGPAVLLSFLLAGGTAALAALCYAELASSIPVSGSSYTYTYATMGEIVAFLVGSCLFLEWGVASAAVAVGWAEYLNSLLQDVIGWQLPDVISAAPGEGGFINLPAMVLVMLCCALLARGTRESATVNAITVVIKLSVLVLFCVIAFTAFSSDNLAPFAPMGLASVGTAASTLFFSYLGMDIVSTAGEEVRDPRRAIPRAILWCVVTVTVLYLLVAVAALGAQDWRLFAGQEAGLAAILNSVTHAGWPAVVLAAGGVVSIFGVTLTCLFAQTRILYAMSRDGMLPPVLHRVHPRTRTPVRNTLIVSALAAVLSGLLPLSTLANLTSMGTLIAFVVVSVGVLVLRRTQPNLTRGFRVPGHPFVPLLAVAACLYLVVQLGTRTYVLFAIWIALALVLYFTYSVRHSRLGTTAEPEQGKVPVT